MTTTVSLDSFVSSSPTGSVTDAATHETNATTTTRSQCFQTQWKIIIGITVGTYLGFLIIISIMKFACAPFTRSKEDDEAERLRAMRKSHSSTLTTQIHLKSMALMKGANIAGRIILIVYSMCVIASFILYVRLTYFFYDAEPPTSKTLLTCFLASQVPQVHADFGINIFYCLVFIIRIVACDSMLTFWLSMDTIADHVTLIPSLIMYTTDRHLIAFQYARLNGLRFFVNTLIYCNMVKGEKYIRLLNLLIQIISVWLISAGFFQLIEGVGDFWLDGIDGATTHAGFHTFHDCFYYLLITMSTVGYGDISPKTVLSKFFIIFFIIIALGMFTRIIPEISEILTESKKYRRNRIHLKHGKSHVVVIGNFTVSMLNTFFSDFYHQERSDHSREFVALLGECEPNLELKAVLKTRELYATYLQGNVMSIRDLQRAEVKNAAAVIIMADHLALDHEDEDMKNIMRVIAIKDFCPDVKILVQLHLYRSKTYLRNIPDWGPQHCDQSVCINEIKYGLLAQSCMVPGLSTLLCNLLMLRSCEKTIGAAKNSWSQAYLHGVEYEFYKVRFPSDFKGLNFLQACRVCYEELGLVLLAVEVTQLGVDEEDVDGGEGFTSRRTIINPGTFLTIDPNTMEAFVIAKDGMDAKRIEHLHLSKVNHSPGASQTIANNHTDEGAGFTTEPTVQVIQMQSLDLPKGDHSKGSEESQILSVAASSTELQPLQLLEGSDSSVQHMSINQSQPQELKFDSSGYFHWVPNRSASTTLLMHTQHYNFRNHVVVCVLEKNPEVQLNITSFIMPLRASSIPRDQLKDIIFVGNDNIVFNEWSIVQNFPNIFVLNGSPLNRANLKAVNIEYVDSCVILAPRASSLQHDAQVDRETVLCTLNIKTMHHPENGKRLGDIIHIITELNTEDAIAYLDQDDDDEVTEPYMTQAFATGRTFFHSLLGSIVTTIYFNGAALNFLRTVVTTVDSDDLEINLNEQGFHFMAPTNQESQGTGCYQTRSSSGQVRSVVQLLEVTKPPLVEIFRSRDECCWRDLLMTALEKLHVVCFGVYRLQVEEPDATKKHSYVITMPDDTLLLRETDRAYCLTPPIADIYSSAK